MAGLRRGGVLAGRRLGQVAAGHDIEVAIAVEIRSFGSVGAIQVADSTWFKPPIALIVEPFHPVVWLVREAVVHRIAVRE